MEVMHEELRTTDAAKGRCGRYEMVTPIAAGGMASVWAARLRGPAGFSKIVAIKSMLPELANEAAFRTMFLDEARVASRLHHPNVCETFDLGEDNGDLFMAMEWIDGVSLYRALKCGGGVAHVIPPGVAVRIVAGACAGLHAAHEALDEDGSPLAIVHRDVSPQNLLISAEGHVKVTDFGVAKARGKRHATCAGQAKGKLAYMAPEQLRRVPVDRRADVFALGCVLYEITTGEKPFEAETDLEVMQAIIGSAPRRPSAIVPGYPHELERIVARAMAKDPSERFASAEGLRLALERWASTSGAIASDRDVAVLVHERCGAEIAALRERIVASTRAEAPSSADRHDDEARPVAILHPPPEGRDHDQGRDWVRRFVIGLGGAVIAIGFGSLVWSASPAAIDARTTGPAERTVTVAPPASTDPSPAITTTASLRPADRTAEDTTRVTLHVDPPNAQLVVDGDVLELDAERAPTIGRPTAGEMRIVLIKAPGRVDRLLVIDESTPAAVEITLVASEPAVLSSR
jgi:eukaryotic-like serine/threonine-protein kinase